MIVFIIPAILISELNCKSNLQVIKTLRHCNSYFFKEQQRLFVAGYDYTNLIYSFNKIDYIRKCKDKPSSKIEFSTLTLFFCHFWTYLKFYTYLKCYLKFYICTFVYFQILNIVYFSPLLFVWSLRRFSKFVHN